MLVRNWRGKVFAFSSRIVESLSHALVLRFSHQLSTWRRPQPGETGISYTARPQPTRDTQRNSWGPGHRMGRRHLHCNSQADLICQPVCITDSCLLQLRLTVKPSKCYSGKKSNPSVANHKQLEAGLSGFVRCQPETQQAEGVTRRKTSSARRTSGQSGETVQWRSKY